MTQYFQSNAQDNPQHPGDDAKPVPRPASPPADAVGSSAPPPSQYPPAEAAPKLYPTKTDPVDTEWPDNPPQSAPRPYDKSAAERRPDGYKPSAD